MLYFVATSATVEDFSINSSSPTASFLFQFSQIIFQVMADYQLKIILLRKLDFINMFIPSFQKNNSS